jgi:hypothetical protein
VDKIAEMISERWTFYEILRNKKWFKGWW